MFRAQTERMKVQVEAQKAGATIRKADVEAVGTQLDNAGKVIQLHMPKKLEDMDDDELFNQIKMG